MAASNNVKVFCRVRPPNEREGGATSSATSCVTVLGTDSDPLQQTVQLQLKAAPAQPKTFTFDRVFHEHASQNEVFEVVGKPIAKACLQGYNGTIFAYGQTGSGKTFTMQGPDAVIVPAERRLTSDELGLRGLVPRVLDYLFQESTSAAHVEYTFKCSFMEIYNETVFDLLTEDLMRVTPRKTSRAARVTVEGLTKENVNNAQEAAALMAKGVRRRRVGQTKMNHESSRSHSVFVLEMQSKETSADGLTVKRESRLNLVDLAGSERQKSTNATGEQLAESIDINSSLSVLEKVIKGLGEQSTGKNQILHSRDSKLTFILHDSLGGNSKTFMIATVSPADDSAQETLSTFQFAARVKRIRSNAILNEDTSGTVPAMQNEITRLRQQLHDVTTQQEAEKQQYERCIGQLEIELRSQVDLVRQHESTILDRQQELELRTRERDSFAVELETSRHEYETAVSAHAAEVNRLNDEKNTTFEALESKLSGGLATKSVELQESLARITTMSTTIKDLESKLALQTQETQRLLHDKEQRDKQVLDLEATVTQRGDDIDEKDSVISGMKETIENLEAAKAQVVTELNQAKEAAVVVNQKLIASQNELE